ncbi:MAG: lactonase family protein [Ruminiclostridium sp.]|nr:lactonase family protein [Ruminiclostridium sp.]
MDTVDNKYYAYVGTYTGGESKGIYIFRFNTLTGKLEFIDTSSELENPSYLCISKDSSFLYAVMETQVYNGESGGAAAAYCIDKETGKLRLLNIRPTKGKDPCHLTTDSHNRFLFVSNYSEGTLTVFPLEKDGHIGSISSIISHKGSGQDKVRREESHMHYAALTPDERYLCAVDLGLDKVSVYDFSTQNGCSAASEKLSINIKPGSGPRHMEFSPNGNFAYLLTELSSEVVVLKYSKDGRFDQIQTVSTLPSNYKGTNDCAAIHISPGGEFLYASNRGHDSLTLFKTDQNTGMLKMLSHISTQGKTPRDFIIDPSGKFLLAANQHSHTLVTYEISPESGQPELSCNTIGIPNPVCIKFACL